MLKPPKSISEWLSPEAFEEEEFFLKKKDYYAELYQSVHTVREHLSPKGLSLLSYLYAEKDRCERQPIVASTIADFIHVVRLLAMAPQGTQITVIFQATDADTYIFPGVTTICPLHKTTCKLERREHDVFAINMDSTLSDCSPNFCRHIVGNVLDDMKIPYQFCQRKICDDESHERFTRQRDWYHCGIFATKDARELNRDADFSTRVASDNGTVSTYDLPAKYLKSAQSERYRNYLLRTHKDTVVNRRQDTLARFYKKYAEGQDYADHFNHKYHEWVKRFLSHHAAQPDVVKYCTELYDAGHLTMDRLITVYGPSSENSRSLDVRGF